MPGILKNIECLFEHLSGLKINFDESEVYCFGEAKDREHLFRDVFTSASGDLPTRYLGIPLHNVKLRNSDWNRVEVKWRKSWVW